MALRVSGATCPLPRPFPRARAGRGPVCTRCAAPSLRTPSRPLAIVCARSVFCLPAVVLTGPARRARGLHHVADAELVRRRNLTMAGRGTIELGVRGRDLATQIPDGGAGFHCAERIRCPTGVERVECTGRSVWCEQRWANGDQLLSLARPRRQARRRGPRPAGTGRGVASPPLCGGPRKGPGSAGRDEPTLPGGRTRGDIANSPKSRIPCLSLGVPLTWQTRRIPAIPRLTTLAALLFVRNPRSEGTSALGFCAGSLGFGCGSAVCGLRWIFPALYSFTP